MLLACLLQNTLLTTSIAGHAAFFGLMAELRDPYDFPKSLFLLQSIDVSLYLVAAVVIYYYAGPGVESPALGSAGPLLSKISYGIALPTVSSPAPYTTNSQSPQLTPPRLSSPA